MSTNRTDLVNGIGIMMAAFIAANPTLLKRHFGARPKSLITDWPCSYLDNVPSTIHYDSSLREENYLPEIVFADRETDSDETSTRLDVLVDKFTDFLDGYSHIVAGTVWSDAQWTDESIPLSDSTSAAGVRLRIGPVSFKPGRL